MNTNEDYAEQNRRMLDEKIGALRSAGWDVVARRERDLALSQRDDAQDEVERLREDKRAAARMLHEFALARGSTDGFGAIFARLAFPGEPTP